MTINEKNLCINTSHILNKIIYIDIDGILTKETKGIDFKNRTPNLENIQIVNSLSINNKIVLYTSRYIIDCFTTRKWLKKYNVVYNKIIFNKYKYDYFIDDKCYNNFKIFFKKDKNE